MQTGCCDCSECNFQAISKNKSDLVIKNILDRTLSDFTLPVSALIYFCRISGN